MRLAIFADIHANRQAFSACLDAARARGAERVVCLGDVVGYGADPEWAVDTVMGLVADGAIAVIGNHDHAISTPTEGMNAVATAAIEWTRGRLSAPQQLCPFTQRTDMTQNAAAISEQFLADGCQDKTAAHAIKEPDAELLFEIADLP